MAYPRLSGSDQDLSDFIVGKFFEAGDQASHTSSGSTHLHMDSGKHSGMIRTMLLSLWLRFSAPLMEAGGFVQEMKPSVRKEYLVGWVVGILGQY